MERNNAFSAYWLATWYCQQYKNIDCCTKCFYGSVCRRQKWNTRKFSCKAHTLNM